MYKYGGCLHLHRGCSAGGGRSSPGAIRVRRRARLRSQNDGVCPATHASLKVEFVVITTLDYNPQHVHKIEYKCEITSDPQRIASAARLLLAGGGRLRGRYESLERGALVPLVNAEVLRDRVAMLGVFACLTQGSNS
jgi:hypothetical protein